MGKKPNLQPLQREIATVDAQLAAAGAEKSTLESRLAQSLPPAQIAEAGKRLKAVNEDIERLEERWIALSGELEALVA